MKRILTIGGLFYGLVGISGLSTEVSAANYYVSPAGNDNSAGTKEQPFATMGRGQTAAQAGDTVFFRGGEYKFVSSTAEIAVNLNKSGSSGKRIHYFAYPGELPVFNFSGMTAQKRIKGLSVSGSWLHIKGIEMKEVPQHPDMRAKENWCIHANNASNNIYERLNLHHHMGPGIFLVEGSNNLVLNCDSHNNYDAYSYTDGALNAGENADGFGFHGKNTTSSGTVFRGCRAWWNADDGYDFIGAATSVTVENCWAWNNGYKAGTTQSAGNGNGFKVGGFGMPPDPPANIPKHIVRFSLAFNNKAAGFYQNHHPESNYYYNNTSYNNKSANFNLLGYDMGRGADASNGILRNNIAFMGTATSNANTSSVVDAKNNSWNITPAVAASDFISTDSAGVGGPRQADGSLPNISFMKLKQGSAMVDKGVDVQLAFNGSAPDLGAFEYGATTSLVSQGKNAGKGHHFKATSGKTTAIDANGRVFRIYNRAAGPIIRE